jgi:hypothetical protein
MDFYLTTSASTFPRIKITWPILQVKYCRCSHLVRRQRNAVITHYVTIAEKYFSCIRSLTRSIPTRDLKLHFLQLFLVRSNKMYINFHSIISIYNTFHLLFKRVRCQQNLNMYERRCLVSYKRELTTHFTDMCIPHFFLASERRSTFDAGLVTKIGAFSSFHQYFCHSRQDIDYLY